MFAEVTSTSSVAGPGHKRHNRREKEKPAMANDMPLHVANFLGGIAYPVSKADLIDHVRQQGADEDVVATLERLPDQTFREPFELSGAFGELEIGREERAFAEPLAAQGTWETLHVANFLGGIAYPVSKADLIDHVRQQGADEDVVATLERLPDQTFREPFELSGAFGELEIGREERAIAEPLAGQA